MRAVTGEKPSARASAAENPVVANPTPKMLTIDVPTIPAKRSRAPAAQAPATRPALFAVVPSGIHVGRPVTRWVTSAQSPAANTPRRLVSMRSSVRIAPLRPISIPAAVAISTFG